VRCKFVKVMPVDFAARLLERTSRQRAASHIAAE
jgi:hypothetical protein